jgi:putative copper resistance protein D
VRILYLSSVWLHILAATVWVGGLFFLVLVIVPWLRTGRSSDAGTFLRETGERFRFVGWICFGVLAATGVLNLWVRGVRRAELGSVEWWTTPSGTIVLLKLLTFIAVLGISAVHDFHVGPEAAIEMQRDPRSKRSARLRHRASLLGRVNGMLALLLVALGVLLVRGWR